jgi:hypothetical protein
MKSRILVLSAFALALALIMWPAVVAAQERTTGGAQTTGTAVPRGGDSGGSAVSRGGDTGSSGSSSAGVGSSGGSGGMGTMGSSGGPSGPTHFPGEMGVRRAPGGASSISAMPMGVPAQSRPRGGQPSQGEAVERARQTGQTGLIPAQLGTTGYYYDPWSSTFGYSGYGYGYSPWGYSPYGFYPYGYGLYGLSMGYFYYDPLYGNPYGYGYGGYGYGLANAAENNYGAIKLKVKPKDAEVYVDGYYIGRVDDFNGVFQHLDLEAGPHRIEVKAAGFQPLTFEVRSLPGRTITYQGELQPAR